MSDAAQPRVAALDGVRGVAILLVMACHFTFLPADTRIDAAVRAVNRVGWMGVDLFFVLSGYLITSILRQYRGNPTYYSAFYGRRVLRIFPLYYLVLAVTLLLLPAVADLGRIDCNPLWYLLHASNVQMAIDGFSHKSLGIAWSLAIEEQFYLVWPVVVSLVSPRRLAGLCLGVWGAAIATRLVLELAGVPHVTTYVLTPCRLDGLALGAFLACASKDRLVALGRGARYAGPAAAVIVGAFLVAGRSGHMVGLLATTFGYAAIAVMWASLLAVVLTTPRAARLFEAAPLVAFGKYSYAIYLFHVAIALILRDSFFGPAVWPRVGGSLLVGQLAFHLLAGAISFGLAWISWRVFEEPILRLKSRFAYAAWRSPPDMLPWGR